MSGRSSFFASSAEDRRRHQANSKGKGFMSGSLTTDIVRRLLKWKRRAQESLKRRRHRVARRLMRRDAAKVVELEEFWLQVTLEELLGWSLRELRVACASRDLDQIGTRADLIDRILQQQRRDLKRVARSEALDKLQRERRGEAKGAVYAVGQGYGPEFHSWDRLFVRGNLSVLQALCGRGVVQVSMGFDSKVVHALCENGDVISFGAVSAAEDSPLGYPDSKVRRLRGNKREELFVSGTDRQDAEVASPPRAGMEGGKDHPPRIEEEAKQPDRRGIAINRQRRENAAAAAAGPGRGGDWAATGAMPGGAKEEEEEDDDDDDHANDGDGVSREDGRGRRRGRGDDAEVDNAAAGLRRRAVNERPELGGPVSVEPLEPTGDDRVGEDLVRRGTRPPKVPELPTQPHHRQFGEAGQANVPAGVPPDPKRVPVRLAPRKPGEMARDGGGRVDLGNAEVDRVGWDHEEDRLRLGLGPSTAGAAVGGRLGPTGDGKDPDAGPSGRGLPVGSSATMQARNAKRAEEGGELPPGVTPAEQRQRLHGEVDWDAHKFKRDKAGGADQAGPHPAGVPDEPLAAAAELLPPGRQARDRVNATDGSAFAPAGMEVTRPEPIEDAPVRSVGRGGKAKAAAPRALAKQAGPPMHRADGLGNAADNQLMLSATNQTLRGPMPGEDRRLAAPGSPMRVVTAPRPLQGGAEALRLRGREHLGNASAGGLVASRAGGAVTAERGEPLHAAGKTIDIPWVTQEDKAEWERRQVEDGLELPGQQAAELQRAEALGFDADPKDRTGEGALEPRVTMTKGGRRRRRGRSKASSRKPRTGRGRQRAADGGAGAGQWAGGLSSEPPPPALLALAEHSRRRKLGVAGRGTLAPSLPALMHGSQGPGTGVLSTMPIDFGLGGGAMNDLQGFNAVALQARGSKAMEGRALVPLSGKAVTGAGLGFTDRGGQSQGLLTGGFLTPRTAMRRSLAVRGAPGATFSLDALGVAASEERDAARKWDLRIADDLEAEERRRRRGEAGEEDEEAAAGPGSARTKRSVLGRIVSSISTAVRGAVGGRNSGSTAASGRSKGSGRRKKPLSNEQRKLPGGLEVDDSDPYAAADKEAGADEEWWYQSKGAVDRRKARRGDIARVAGTKMSVAGQYVPGRSKAEAEGEMKRLKREANARLAGEGGNAADLVLDAEDDPLGMEGRVEASAMAGKLGGEGLPMPGRKREKKAFSVDPSGFGGSKNMADIERFVDMDMRGYLAFAPPTEVRELRGEAVLAIAAGRRHCGAVTSGGDMFVWGAGRGGGLGLGADGAFKSYPTLLDQRETLGLPPGGKVSSVAVGTSHSAAITSSGELLMWGSSSGGRLGLGSIRRHGPALQGEEAGFSDNKPAHEEAIERRRRRAAGGGVQAGTSKFKKASDQHLFGEAGGVEGSMGGVLALMSGHTGSSGPGDGAVVGVKSAFVTVPTPVPFFSIAAAAAAGLAVRRRVRQVACGAAHTIVLADDGVYSFGVGDGGRLGLGDPLGRLGRGTNTSEFRSPDRAVPCLVEALRGEVVVQVAASVWHSAAVVQRPPLQEGGLLYIWGSSRTGALGLGAGVTAATEPQLVEGLCEVGVIVSEVSLGMHHSAVLSTDGEVWTFGSNAFSALGRPAQMSQLGDPAYSALPGRMEGLREYGVGPCISVSAGDRTTVVVTAPFDPNSWPEWREREMAALDAAREEAAVAVERDNALLEEERIRQALDEAAWEEEVAAEVARTHPLKPGLRSQGDDSSARYIEGLSSRRSRASSRRQEPEAEDDDERLMQRARSNRLLMDQDF